VVIVTTAWERLGSLVRNRRETLGLSVKDATSGRKISDTTWSKLESGEEISAPKLAQVPPAIRWTSDSPRRVLDGAEPIELDAESDAMRGGHGGTEGWPAWLEDWLRGEINSIRAAVRALAEQVADLERRVEDPPA
jgi:hypothetical protein